jgi:FAD/FMN-containing dehydrogenase
MTSIRGRNALLRWLPWSSPAGAYLNFPGFAEEGEELLRASYGESWERLKQVKATYDPENVFRSNFNIPAG